MLTIQAVLLKHGVVSVAVFERVQPLVEISAWIVGINRLCFLVATPRASSCGPRKAESPITSPPFRS